MEQLAIERLRSPRSPRRSHSSFNSGSSTPFMTAPSSPRACYYYSAPPSPPRKCDEGDEFAASVPFSWEESPGTPKRAEPLKNSVDHLTAMGFHFTSTSAPVSPQREFDFMDGYLQQQQQEEEQMNSPLDEFEFTSARMSDADSVVSASMSHADELFFQGQILPLKLPPRLQQKPSSSLSLSLQLQDFSPRSSERSSFSPRAGRVTKSSFVHQLHSPKSPKSTGGYGYVQSSSKPRSPRAKSPSKLGQVGYPNENRHPVQKPVPASARVSVRKSLKELLHLNTSNNGSSNGRSGSRSSSSGTDSQKSSRSSSGSSSQRFANSRSSSVSSNKSLESARSSFSSKQVAPHELLQNYNKHKVSSTDELRRRTFLPYRQGLLGCLGFQEMRH